MRSRDRLRNNISKMRNEPLADLLQNAVRDGKYSIALFGEWGSGLTNLYLQAIDELKTLNASVYTFDIGKCNNEVAMRRLIFKTLIKSDKKLRFKRLKFSFKTFLRTSMLTMLISISIIVIFLSVLYLFFKEWFELLSGIKLFESTQNSPTLQETLVIGLSISFIWIWVESLKAVGKIFSDRIANRILFATDEMKNWQSFDDNIRAVTPAEGSNCWIVPNDFTGCEPRIVSMFLEAAEILAAHRFRLLVFGSELLIKSAHSLRYATMAQPRINNALFDARLPKLFNVVINLPLTDMSWDFKKLSGFLPELNEGSPDVQRKKGIDEILTEIAITLFDNPKATPRAIKQMLIEARYHLLSTPHADSGFQRKIAIFSLLRHLEPGVIDKIVLENQPNERETGLKTDALVTDLITSKSDLNRVLRQFGY